MKQFMFYLKRLPKRFAMAATVLTALVALPLQSVFAADIRLEGSIGVRNISVDGSPANLYQVETDATYNQVVEFRVFYHNMEQPDSGKVAHNLKLNVDFPTASGRTQVVKATISADNSNVIEDTATVRLNRDDARIEYIPGTAKWDHNPGSRTDARIVENIADNKLTGTVLEDAKPCYEYQAYVTFQARVTIPSVGVYKTVRETPAAGAPKPVMQENITSKSGTSLDYVVSAKNLSNVNLTNVYLRDQLPQGVTYVAGSAKKTYGQFKSTPMDAAEVEAFFTGKKNVGTLLPGAEAFITFKAIIVGDDKLACNSNKIVNIAVVDTDQTGEYNDEAVVTVNRVCADVPAYACDMLDINKGDNRTVTISQFKTSQTNGATFKDAIINWGDGTDNLTTNTVIGQKHTYAKDGTYTVSATARFTVNGQVVTANGANCAKSVVFTTAPTPPTTPAQPTALPKTGAGDVIGLFGAATALGAVAHRMRASRL